MYTGMLTAIGNPNWKEETKLFRFVECNGCSTAFTVCKDALSVFSDLKLWSIYTIEVPGNCVKACSNQNKTGVRNHLEVRVVLPLKCKLSSTSWPLTAVYDFVPWQDLNQKITATFVDLVGRVLSTPVLDQNSSLPKLKVDLGFKDMRQTVTLLRPRAIDVFKTNDILVFGGLRIKEWDRERTLESSFLTMIEVNPAARTGLELINEIGEDEPRRKVMRVTLPDTARVRDVLSWSQQLLLDAPTTDCKEFLLVGKLTPLDDGFFDSDPPLVGDYPNEKMCWHTAVADGTGSCPVRLWDSPCYELFQQTAIGLRAKWEEGLEDPSKRVEILQHLNRNIGENVRCICKLKVWSFGTKPEKHEPQVNVNLLDGFEN